MRGLRVVAAAGVLITAGVLVAWPAAAKTEDVSIKNIAYAPASLTIDAGDRVIWTNNENAVRDNHTVTEDNGAFASPNCAPSTHFTFGRPALPTTARSTTNDGTVVVRAHDDEPGQYSAHDTAARATTTSRRVTRHKWHRPRLDGGGAHHRTRTPLEQRQTRDQRDDVRHDGADRDAGNWHPRVIGGGGYAIQPTGQAASTF